MTNLRSSLARCRRPVIKIGSAVLAGGGGKASLDRQPISIGVLQAALWDFDRGNMAAASAGADWLKRHAAPASGDVIDMLVATAARRADAAVLRARVDSSARGGCCTPPHWINLAIARASESAGDDTSALRALRRGRWRVPTMFLSTYLRNEGRVAERLGDRASAIRALEQYLALRSNPEPQLRPDRDSIQAEVARLRRGR